MTHPTCLWGRINQCKKNGQYFGYSVGRTSCKIYIQNNKTFVLFANSTKWGQNAYVCGMGCSSWWLNWKTHFSWSFLSLKGIEGLPVDRDWRRVIDVRKFILHVQTSRPRPRCVLQAHEWFSIFIFYFLFFFSISVLGIVWVGKSTENFF